MLKRLTLLIFIISVGCSPKEVNSVESQPVDLPDTQVEGRQYLPKKEGKKYKISQKDIILNEAVAISNDFYSNLKNQNYSGANKHMHPDALSVTSIPQWIEIYKKAQDKKGRLGFVKMYDYGVKQRMLGGNGIGDYAELIFDAQYKDGNFREKITFFRKDSTEAVMILGYQYDEMIERVKLYEKLE